eukprot:4746093-Pleurochrysis_carterae.AAC.1
MGSMVTAATSAGGVTASVSAAPRGASCAAPPGIPPLRCARARRSAQRCTAGGYGCCPSNRRCLRCTHAATRVDTRSNRFGANAPPNPIHLSTSFLVPPQEALRPLVRLLHRAEAVGGFRVGHPRHRSQRLFPRPHFCTARADDGRGPCQRLHPGQCHHALRVRHAGVDPVRPSEARVRRDSGLRVLLHAHLALLRPRHPLAGLHDD